MQPTATGPVLYHRKRLATPNGEYSERRAAIDDWGDSDAALIIQSDELIPVDSDVEVLRYEI